MNNPHSHQSSPRAIFLDVDALKELTGFSQKRRQIEQLRVMGVPFWINRAGKPVVSRAAVEGGKVPKEASRAWAPAVLGDR